MLKYYLAKALKKTFPFAFIGPEGERGIKKMGHRAYIGGNWESIGSLQFDLLVSKGMTPNSYLLDIACGSLRLGVKAIPFLERGHYLGIEKESGLVAAGLEKELGSELQLEKAPSIVISDAFEFDKLNQLADFAIAQSLFSHFPPDLINLCFRKLYPYLTSDGVFYATYFEVAEAIRNPDKPHDHGYHAYTAAEMVEFGEANGYSANYIGDWNHPAGQVIVEYRKR